MAKQTFIRFNSLKEMGDHHKREREKLINAMNNPENFVGSNVTTKRATDNVQRTPNQNWGEMQQEQENLAPPTLEELLVYSKQLQDAQAEVIAAIKQLSGAPPADDKNPLTISKVNKGKPGRKKGASSLRRAKVATKASKAKKKPAKRK